MDKKLHITILLSLAIIVFNRCKKPYEPPIIKTETHFLVVDGMISCGNNAVTKIVLSRSTRLGDSIQFAPELNAFVSIEEEQGSHYNLTEQGNGIYLSQQLSLDPDKKFRLIIKTTNNKNYISAFTEGKTSPPIDSLTWKQKEDVIISVNTHDPSNNARYYRWDYIETWNYRSIYSTDYGVNNGLIYVKDFLTQTDSCWRTSNSTNIILSSSVNLSEDVISDFPVAIVPQHTEKISLGYSILVRQYALPEKAFQYLRIIQKNTQQLGSLFDGQPSQLKGNILCVENPGEPVMGYISASTVTEKRMFIRNSQVANWHFAPSVEFCGVILTIPQNSTSYLIFDYPDTSFGPYYFVTGGLVITKKACLECTEQGGANLKPNFW